MVVDDWKEFIQLALNFAGHGYLEYSSFIIPEQKVEKAQRIDMKIQAKFPETGYDKDRRYRNKKAGQANLSYLRWRNIGLILRTEGEVNGRFDEEKFVRFDEEPFVFAVGSMIEIKIAKARAGRKYTAYLSKQSFRAIKAILRDNLRHRRRDVAEAYWERLKGLPAFSGILGQMRELTVWIKIETKLAGLKKWTGNHLVLRPL